MPERKSGLEIHDVVLRHGGAGEVFSLVHRFVQNWGMQKPCNHRNGAGQFFNTRLFDANCLVLQPHHLPLSGITML
jgi:hypothetical protein